MREFHSTKSISRSVVVGYVSIITAGTLLLMLPFSSRGISFIDALFTSTSATCVTGLIVKDTAKDFTLFGKVIIGILIQIGGIGYMSFSALLLGILRGKLTFSERLTITDSYKTLSSLNLWKFILRVMLFTFIFESVGLLFLFLGFIRSGLNFWDSFGQALFHSVSAFCNAGFSTFSQNLALYSRDFIIPITVGFLLFVGGLGFPVLSELFSRRKITSIHTKIVIWFSILLLLIGLIHILLVEWKGALSIYPWYNKFVIGIFHSLTPRTAGFSLVDISKFNRTTIILTMLLMFIGASPGGTGGGIKTTTMAVLLVKLKSVLKGEKPSVFSREIPGDTVDSAFAIFLFSILWLLTSSFIILLYEDMDTMRALFEVVSAFGTVGLSLGSKVKPFVSASSDFTVLGKIVIIVTMLVGRVGILTFLSSMITRERVYIKKPEGKVVVG